MKNIVKIMVVAVLMIFVQSHAMNDAADAMNGGTKKNTYSREWYNFLAATILKIPENATNEQIEKARTSRIAQEKTQSHIEPVGEEAAQFLLDLNESREQAKKDRTYTLTLTRRNPSGLFTDSVREHEDFEYKMGKHNTRRYDVYNKKRIGLTVLGITSVFGVVSYFYRNELASLFQLSTTPLYNFITSKISRL